MCWESKKTNQIAGVGTVRLASQSQGSPPPYPPPPLHIPIVDILGQFVPRIVFEENKTEKFSVKIRPKIHKTENYAEPIVLREGFTAIAKSFNVM